MKEDNNLAKKIRKIHIFLLIFAVIAIISGVRWEAVDAEKLSLVAKQREFSETINSVRGTIYSKDNTTLAYSEPKFDMYIWTDDLTYFEGDNIKLQTREEFLRKVASIINSTPQTLGNVINDNLNIGHKWIQVAKSLSDQQWRDLNNLKTDKFNAPLRGFHFIDISKRIYPEGRLASHLLGLTNIVNNKVVGLGGVEGSWNETLNPIKGLIVQENNAKGEAVTTALTATVEAKNGSSVHTSIDKNLQKIAENEIKAGVQKYEAKSGSIIIMDPKTGQIFALANFPDYDPNLRQETDPNVYGNAAVSSPYEMGSIGKALTISAAVDLNRLDAETIILPNGHNGCEKFTDELGPLCTWDHKPIHRPMKVKDCFALSDNICLFHLSKEHLSKAEFRSYLDKFGIGKPSGIDLAGESYGELRPLDKWTIGDIAATSYGHGYSVNAIQALNSIATIANNGVRMKPYVVTKIVDSDGNINNFQPEVVETVLKQDTVTKLIDMMRYNLLESTLSDYKDMQHYDLCVKSGTALIADSNGYSNETNDSFVGFDCSLQRSFIMFVKLEKPKNGLSFYNVRPLWFDTFRAIKDVIGVQKKN